MRLVVFLISAAVTLVVSRVNAELTFDQQRIKLELQEGKIFPDALDEFEPSAFMRISYGEDNTVENGKILSPEITMEAPRLWFTFPNPDAEYTFAMINLDSNAPQIVHWLSPNINAASNEMPEVKYLGPAPPEGSGLHRIVYVLFEQADKNIDIRVQDRDHFDLKRFMTDYKLTPLSAAYIYTQHEAKEIKQQGLVDDLIDSVGHVIDGVPGLINNVGDIVDDVGHIVGGIHIGEDARGVELPNIDDTIPPIFHKHEAKEVKQQGLVDDLIDSVGHVIDGVPGLINNVGDIVDDVGHIVGGIHIGEDARGVELPNIDDTIPPILHEEAVKPSLSHAARLPLPSSHRRLHAPNKDKNIYVSVNGDGQYSVSL